MTLSKKMALLLEKWYPPSGLVWVLGERLCSKFKKKKNTQVDVLETPAYLLISKYSKWYQSKNTQDAMGAQWTGIEYIGMTSRKLSGQRHVDHYWRTASYDTQEHCEQKHLNSMECAVVEFSRKFHPWEYLQDKTILQPRSSKRKLNHPGEQWPALELIANKRTG